MPRLVRGMLTATRKGVVVWELKKGKFQYTSKNGAHYVMGCDVGNSDVVVFTVFRKDKVIREYTYTGDEKKNHAVFGLYNYLCKKNGTRPEETKGGKKPKSKK